MTHNKTIKMKNINVPTRDQVNSTNQTIFDNLKSKLGFVPNLYATYAHSETGLANILAIADLKTSLSNKEKEIINLAVSQVNECEYCLAAHTAIGKMNGFTEEQIIAFRNGESSDPKFDALAKLAKDLTKNRGKASQDVLDNFFAQGYTEGNLVDSIILVGEKTIANYLHRTTNVPVDFPAAPEI